MTASLAANLAQYVQDNDDTQDLIELTNWNDTNASTVNVPSLEKVCVRAIHWFEAHLERYDPSTYPWHNSLAMLIVLRLLYWQRKRDDEAQRYESMIKEFWDAVLERRSIAPVISSNYEPSSAPDGKPPFDRTEFDDIRPR